MMVSEENINLGVYDSTLYNIRIKSNYVFMFSLGRENRASSGF